MKKEISVYVIELNQPFVNWYGTLKSYNHTKNVCVVINDQEEEVEIRFSEAQEAETMQPLKKYLMGYYNQFISLLDRGLNEAEADQFLNLLAKIKPTEADLEGFDVEMESGIPFEGGMGFTEALTGLKLS